MRPAIVHGRRSPAGPAAALLAAGIVLSACTSSATPTPAQTAAPAASSTPPASAPAPASSATGATPTGTPASSKVVRGFDLTFSGAFSAKISGTTGTIGKMLAGSSSADQTGCTLFIRGEVYPELGADGFVNLQMGGTKGTWQGDAKLGSLSGQTVKGGGANAALADVGTFTASTSTITIRKLSLSGTAGTVDITGTITCP
jgi:hypothetical protein